MFGVSSKMKCGVALLVMAVLSGCKVGVQSDLYARDVFSNENLTFPSQLKVQVPSCSSDKVEEASSDILALFSQSSEASISGCVREGMDSMLVVKFKGEMADKDSSADFTIFRNHQEGKDFVYLTAAFNTNFQKRVEQLMSSQMTSLDYEDLTVGFTMNNDLSGALEYSMLAGWVDGQPGQRFGGELDRREKISVISTNIVSDMVLKNQQPELITLRQKEG
jgi:hypothetical protein